MHILLTRPEQDAARTREILVARGHTVTSVPLFEIEPLHPDPAALSAATALAITSANGIRTLDAALENAGWPTSEINKLRALPLFVVGRQTAAAAAAAGFSDVRHVALDGAALVAFLTTQNLYKDKFVHICGADLSTDLEAALTAAGIACRKLVAYRQTPRPGADRKLVESLTAATPIECTLFLSAKTALRFADIIEDQRLGAALKHITALCFSDTVAAPVNNIGFAKVRVAQSPSLEDLIDLIPPPRCDE